MDCGLRVISGFTRIPTSKHATPLGRHFILMKWFALQTSHCRSSWNRDSQQKKSAGENSYWSNTYRYTLISDKSAGMLAAMLPQIPLYKLNKHRLHDTFALDIRPIFWVFKEEAILALHEWYFRMSCMSINKAGECCMGKDNLISLFPMARTEKRN